MKNHLGGEWLNKPEVSDRLSAVSRGVMYCHKKEGQAVTGGSSFGGSRKYGGATHIPFVLGWSCGLNACVPLNFMLKP